MIKKLFGSGAQKKVSTDEPFYTDLEQINRAHHKITYRGLPMLKCPFDTIIYQMIISELRPDLILEIGTLKGGSALWFSDLLRSIGGGTVHSVDLNQSAIDAKVVQAENIELFEGGWQNYDLAKTAPFEKILIVDDGSHTYDDVKGAFMKLSKLVKPGSYYIIEDGVLDQLDIPKKKFGGGPIKAVKEILDEDHTFELDHKWLHFFGRNATFNPMGYLRKK